MEYTYAKLHGVAMKYKLIYADPPWQYDNATGRNNVSGSASKYPTMTLSEICDLPIISDIVDTKSALFLWVTIPLMPYGFEVLAAWGFKYKTAIFWHKSQSLGLGNWFRGQVEVLLVGVHGKLKPFHCQEPNFLQEKARNHSRKPDAVRELLNSLELDPKIELFARERWDGWDAWGNGLPSTKQVIL